jgi:hypothetical protein
MGNKNWKDQGFRLDGSTGVLTDLSAQVNSQQLSAAITDLITTGMGATSQSRINGLADITIPVNGMVNSTVRGILAPIANGTSVTKTFEYKLYQGAYFNGEALPTNIQFSGSPDTLELFSLTLAVTGALNSTSVALA